MFTIVISALFEKQVGYIVISRQLPMLEMRTLSIFLTEDIHVFHNDCLWGVVTNRLFKSDNSSSSMTVESKVKGHI